MELMFCEYPDIMSVRQMQHALGIGRSWAYKLLEQGQIKHFRIGRNYKIPKSELVNYVKRSNC